MTQPIDQRENDPYRAMIALLFIEELLLANVTDKDLIRMINKNSYTAKLSSITKEIVDKAVDEYLSDKISKQAVMVNFRKEYCHQITDRVDRFMNGEEI